MITEAVDDLYCKIKNGGYSFLGTYLDFSTIEELIEQLENENLKKERNKVR
ncbi:hypothetical protein LCGC14_0853870 [marine sediment metagenome]|uniref:Uncharacterized protein n=1 Tax=marine sediment metagenome TaxID=412755 RepID=A0A0F9SGI3_9ZZZZ